MKHSALILLLGLFAVGCSSTQAVNMIPKGLSYQYPAEQVNNISVDRVVTGQNANSWSVTSIAGDENRTFQSALKKSLARMQLFSPNGRYLLKTTFEKVESTFMFIDATITSEVRYILIDRANGSTVMNELVEATFTATFSDAFVGAKRMEMALEGSARENIGKFLEKLSQLSGTSPPGYVPTESTTEEGEMMF